MRAPRLLPVVLILPLVLAAGACSGDDDGGGGASTTQGKPSTADVAFEGTNWVLTDRSDLGVPLGNVAVTAQFTADTMSGSSGCNTYRAPIARDDPKVEVTGPIAVTQIACIGPSTDVEQAYLALLPKVRTFAISGDRLTLSNLGGTALLVYRAGGVDDLVGNWVATSLYTGNAIQSVALDTELTATLHDRQGQRQRRLQPVHRRAPRSRGTTIALGPLASTLMACPEPAATQEQQYLAALELARTWEVRGDRLTLFREGGTIAATFDRA